MFADRAEAGRKLAEAVAERLAGDLVNPLVVLGLPRGGVIVAEAVAEALHAPLDVVVPRKIGAPENPELAIGAIAPGVQVWDRDLVDSLRVPTGYLRRTVAEQEAEIGRRTAMYRAGRPPLHLEGTTVVVVDDGIATGATAVAAIRCVRRAGASRVMLAVPVAPADAVRRLEAEADEVIALETPRMFRSVGEWYESFAQTDDDEVMRSMQRGSS